MKKRVIAAVIVALLAIVIAVVVLIAGNTGMSDSSNQTTTVVYSNAQLGLTVDSWLKIISIDEFDGRLAVVAENVSDTDVEYAQLTVETKNGTLSFNVSAFLAGTKAVLFCNENVGSNPDESYTSWKIHNKLLFENPPVMNEDKLEVSLAENSISVRNISGVDISSDIYIYYKEKKDDLFNGSFTGRIRVPGLKDGAQTFVDAQGINADNCQIIFTDYDDTQV